MPDKESTLSRARLRRALAERHTSLLTEFPWPAGLRAVVLAPHPDDFDAIAVTMRFFRDRGDDVHLGVFTLSPRGVEDSFCSPPTDEVKSALREQEQRDSCLYFGLPDDHLVFLHVTEDGNGDPIDDAANFQRVQEYLAALRPDLVLLPHGNDTNAGHRFTFRMLQSFAQSHDTPAAALLNRDPKTVAMRVDLRMFFDNELADWKAAMLRCHRSQQQRNLNLRGYGFDERILRVNREAAARFPGGGSHAEEFEIWLPDADSAQRGEGLDRP
jgi:LmbE family N-acetylglucosaminyl deacetylase